MVTISNYFIRGGKLTPPFIALELTGSVELIQSMQTGNFYASAKKCTIPSTFTEDVAKTLIGTRLPGRIDRVEVEAYDYVNPTTGEVTTLHHSYQYVKEEAAQSVTQEKSVLA